MFSSKDFEKLWFLYQTEGGPRRSPLIHSVKRMVYPMKSLTSGFARLTSLLAGLRLRTFLMTSLRSSHQGEGAARQNRLVYRLQFRPAMDFIFARSACKRSIIRVSE